MAAHHLLVRGARGSIPVAGPQFARYGGMTSCFELTGSERVVIDAGTGILDVPFEPGEQFHVFLTHYHLDHVMGLTAFPPMFDHAAELTFHGPDDVEGPRQALSRVLAPPLFPVSLEDAGALMTFHAATGAEKVGDYTITPFPVRHPDGCRGYRIDGPRRSVAIATDHEGGSERNAELAEHVAGVDVLIHDAQFTLAEAGTHIGWGHSTWEDAVEVAELAGVPRLILTSHAPQHTDTDIDRIVATARHRCQWIAAAHPGMEIRL